MNIIDRATIDKIMSAANIVEVVQEFVTLRKSGVNYKGLCPFHNEKTPSFFVSPTRGICHCFSCGKGGNAVTFLMEHEQMTYPEALKWLARKYHIEVKEKELTDEERQAESTRESMFIVNEWASGYFQRLLHEHEDGQAVGLQYFRSRGIRDDIIRKFCLGYDLPSRDALPQEAIKKGYKEEFLVKTGLCYKRDSDGRLNDRFAGRVIFPWFSVSGKIVAFGGRLLDSRTKGVQLKYVNSPDSEIYHKERELYGIYQAKRAIAKENCVYMVEGYTDVIAMHQAGIENVVANSGTALSYEQIRMLHRFTPNIVLLYDGDEAGIHAALRGTDMLLSEGMNIKVLLFPDGDDPDSFSRKHTTEEFRQYIDGHQTDFIQFKTDVLLTGVTDPIKRSEAISSIVRSISVIGDQIIRATYIHDCSQRLGIQESTLISSMNKFIRQQRADRRQAAEREQEAEERRQEEALAQQAAAPARPAAPVQRDHRQEVEMMIVRLIVRYGERNITVKDEDDCPVTLPVAEYIDSDMAADDLHFQLPVYEKIRQEAVAQSADKDWTAENWFLHHHDVDISKTAAELSVERVRLTKSLQKDVDEETLRERVIHLMADFRLDYVENRMKEIKQSLNGVTDADTMRSLMEEFSRMQIIRNALARQLGNNIIV